ncbi:DUF4439 domain-containing protein [Propionibacterium cyclohexanicum]|uniref:DUF4439 domain-containing protein n=1 Tax=Propionibacterium cyclohexanicum TaxID=64702 RepID=UPI00115F7888|nr:DUF4439 domain-containing protein [Propionibacterium cyclohexanicum]
MISRRAVLLIGGIGALSGCAPSPVVVGSPAAGSASPAQLDAHRREAVREETSLAALNSSCASGAAAWSAPAGFGEWCAAAAKAHAHHATVLAQADPLGGVNADHSPLMASPSPSAPAGGPSGLAEALVALRTGYETLAASHLGVALAQTEPVTAMLWASLYCYADAGRQLVTAHGDGASFAVPTGEGSAVPARIVLGSRDETLQVLLSRVDALRFGLQAMIGRSGDTQTQMVDRVAAVEELRNSIATQLASASARPSAPAIAYTLPGDVNDPSSWPQIWGKLESGVLAAWVPVAATSTGTERSKALASMAAQSLQAPSHGVALSWWPGWV